MKRSRGKQLLRKIGLTGCMVLLGWLSPVMGLPPSPKVDVCHREGNGSFHLITVAYQAIQAHQNHGDGFPFQDVPGAIGMEFDATCTPVVKSSCPCDFTATGLAAVGLDGGPTLAACVQRDDAIGVILTNSGPGGNGLGIAQVTTLFGLNACRLQDPLLGTVVEFHIFTDSGPFTDCVLDLRTAIIALQIPPC